MLLPWTGALSITTGSDFGDQATSENEKLVHVIVEAVREARHNLNIPLVPCVILNAIEEDQCVWVDAIAQEGVFQWRAYIDCYFEEMCFSHSIVTFAPFILGVRLVPVEYGERDGEVALGLQGPIWRYEESYDESDSLFGSNWGFDYLRGISLDVIKLGGTLAITRYDTNDIDVVRYRFDEDWVPTQVVHTAPCQMEVANIQSVLTWAWLQSLIGYQFEKVDKKGDEAWYVTSVEEAPVKFLLVVDDVPEITAKSIWLLPFVGGKRVSSVLDRESGIRVVIKDLRDGFVAHLVWDRMPKNLVALPLEWSEII